jgi:hypothetical protein
VTLFVILIGAIGVFCIGVTLGIVWTYPLEDRLKPVPLGRRPTMDDREMIEFLILCRDKVDLLSRQISINQPLIEVSEMMSGKIEELEQQDSECDE